MLRETLISAIEIVLNRKTKILLCIKYEGTQLRRLSNIEKRIKKKFTEF
jgi:hypothetical protein